MNQSAKQPRNVPAGSAAGQTRPNLPRRKPGAPAQSVHYAAGRKPNAPPSAPAPQQREESSKLRDDEDTLTGIDSDEEE